MWCSNLTGVLYSCFFFTILAEHEECLRDILELKWHVSYEGRQLSRIKDNLRITGLKQRCTFEFEQRISQSQFHYPIIV